MRLKAVLFALLLLGMAATANAYSVATFDDFALTVPPGTNYTGPGGGQYYNGSDAAGGFTSGGAHFLNNYNSTYGSWDGWSVSNTTDTTTAGYTNQFSAYTGGAQSGTQYGVYYQPWTMQPTVSFTSAGPVTLAGAYITNTTYAALSMLNGDNFAKKFGGAGGDDPDWFKLTIRGVGADAQYTANAVEFFLADYRFENNSLDYIIDEWTWVDLTVLGAVYGLEFALTSSDVGSWGMNTPAYFAMDSVSAVPIPGAVWLLGSGLLGLIGIRRRQSRYGSMD